MMSIFYQYMLPTQTQTTIKPRKLPNNAAMWSGEGLCPLPGKFWNFIPGNATFWYILVTIICSHSMPLAHWGCPPWPSLNTPLCRGTVQTTMSHVCSHSNSYNWRNHVRSSLKDALNSSVFICRLNAMYDSVVLTDASRAFQAHAAATGNARSPSVVRHAVCTHE